MADYDASIRVGTEVNTSQMQKLQIQIDKSVQKVDSLAKRLEELKNHQAPTQEYANLESQLNTAKSTLQSLIAEEERLVNDGVAIGAPWDNVLQKEADAQIKIEEILGKMQSLKEAGKAFTVGSDPEAINNAANDLAQAEAELRMLKTRQQELNKKQAESSKSVKKISAGFKKLAAVAGKALGAIIGKGKQANELLSTMASRFKGLALSFLVFNWITKGFNTLVSSMREGFGNLSKYFGDFNKVMSEFKSELATMKNSLAAAFAPIVSAVIPYLTQFIAHINAACDSIARFLAALSGKNTYTKAKKQMVNYADSIKDAQNAAEEAKGSLAGFDKLNVIGNQNNKKSSGGSSGSGAGGFEEAEVGELSDFAQKLKEAIENGDWFSVGAVLAEKLNDILRNIDWRTIQEGARNIATNITSFLNGFIATADWKLVGSTIAEGLNTALIFLFTLITTFDWAAAGQALADSINGFFSTFDWGLVGLTITKGIMGLLEFARTAVQQTDWAAIGNDIASLLRNIDWVGLLKDVGGLMVDAIVSGFELLDSFVDSIVGNQAAFELIAILIGTITAAIVAYNIQQALAATGTTLWSAICGVATAVTTAFGAAMAFLTSPITLIILTIGALIAIIVLLVKNWDKVKAVAQKVWDNIKKVWGNFANWFNTKVWEPFKKGLKVLGNFFIGIWNGIVGAFESAINWIIGGINKALDAINKFIGGAAELLKYVGINLSFQIPNIPEVHFGRVPKLANGAVIRGGQPFLAMLGDQPAGQTNVEAPLSTIKTALKEALRESGNMGGEYTFVAQLNGKTLYRETVRQDQMFRKATGKSGYA